LWFGLDLPVGTTARAGGQPQRACTHLDGSSLSADVHSQPAGGFMSASLEWTPGYFAVLTSRSCIDVTKLTHDLGRGWKVHADGDGRQASTFAASPEERQPRRLRQCGRGRAGVAALTINRTTSIGVDRAKKAAAIDEPKG